MGLTQSRMRKRMKCSARLLMVTDARGGNVAMIAGNYKKKKLTRFLQANVRRSRARKF